jgi:hypothetical protein
MITTQEIVELIQDYYSTDGNAAGGYLHIVLDDGNLEDDDIRFCIEQAKMAGDFNGVLLGYVMLLLSLPEREKVYHKFWN